MQCCITDFFFFEKIEEILIIEISLEESVFLLAVFVIKHGFTGSQ